MWAALLLSVLTAGALAVARTEVRAAYERAENFKALMAARSGLDIAAYLMATSESESIEELHQYAPAELNGYALRFESAPENEKLDINLASEQVFEELFVFFGFDRSNAQGLAARIADWRDADDLARPNGAESRDYFTARNGEKIGNRPFRSTQELLKVLEFPRDLYECVAPAITVLGASATPKESLMTELYGASPFNDQANAKRRLGTSSRARSGGARFAVAVKVEAKPPRQLRLNGLYRMTGSPGAPYQSIIVFRDFSPENNVSADCAPLQFSSG